MRVVEARSGETLGQLSERSGNRWDLNETAVANSLFIGESLEAGQLVKIARREQYRGAPESAAQEVETKAPVQGPIREPTEH